MMWLRKYFSYLLPVPYKKLSSDLTPNIELTFLNGKLVVDSKYANYSYGSLQKILKKAMQIIGFDTIKTAEDILILGVGGGSVIKTLRNDINTRAKIVGVEADEKMLYIAQKYFNIHHLPDIELIHQDAEEFVLKSNQYFDLIIMDLFIETDIPDFVYNNHFVVHIQKLMKNNGYLIFNTIEKNSELSKKNATFQSRFDPLLYPYIQKIAMDAQNQVFIIQKKST